jgi:hypothetical protein
MKSNTRSCVADPIDAYFLEVPLINLKVLLIEAIQLRIVN